MTMRRAKRGGIDMELNGKNTGGTAFPSEGFNGWGRPQEGMTLLDYFAAKAMQALIAQCANGFDVEEVAPTAYFYAESMLKAREL